MAADEFLFNSLTDRPNTFLRFYRWENPTVSLGSSQSIKKAVDIAFCKDNKIDIIRRMTGGKLVLHHREITYSICSMDTGIFSTTLSDSYKRISSGLMRGLELMGLKPELANASPVEYARSVLPCFSHPARNEVEIEGKKIIGSAQKRLGSRFIQHGSIPTGYDEKLLRSVSALSGEEAPIRLITLTEALGKEPDYEQVARFFIQGLSEYFKIECLPYEFSSDDRRQIRDLQLSKYENRDWNQMR